MPQLSALHDLRQSQIFPRELLKEMAGLEVEGERRLEAEGAKHALTD